MDGTKTPFPISFITCGRFSGFIKAIKELVVPKSIPTIISSFCMEPVARFIEILAIILRLQMY